MQPKRPSAEGRFLVLPTNLTLMCQTIIFDFNRTLFNPEVDRLMPQARRVLSVLRRRGCQLFLVTRKEKGRENRIAELGLGEYFSEVFVVPRKSLRLFRSIVEKAAVPPESVAVVGDRLSDEIRLANRLGCRSIRLKAGAFAGEVPQVPEEVPDREIATLAELLPLIR